MGPRHYLSFCAGNTAWLAPEFLVSMGPNPHLWFLHAKLRILDQNFQCLWLPALICGFCMQTATSGPKLHVSLGPRTHLLFSACKTACLASELLVSVGPNPYLWFLHANRDFWSRITSLYRSHTSPVIFCMQNSVPSIKIASLCGSQPLSVVYACKQRLLDQNNKSLWVPDFTCNFLHAKQRA